MKGSQVAVRCSLLAAGSVERSAPAPAETVEIQGIDNVSRVGAGDPSARTAARNSSAMT
jgi:hypothetical protein